MIKEVLVMPDKFTYVADDGFILVDGEAVDGVSIPEVDPEINAIQWENGSGEVEYRDDRPNVPLTSLNDYQIILDKHAEQLAIEEAERNTPEFKAHQIRMIRNGMLLETDWTQLADSPVDASTYTTYRQQLRDITNQENFPDEVVYPEKP